MLTIFSVPKAFEGEFKDIQINAITSWLKIKPRPQIILLGNEFGVKKICREYRLIQISDINKNSFGTPLLNDVFSKAKKKAKFKILLYVNTDILISKPKSVIETINDISKKFKVFLCVGQRYTPNGLLGPDWADYFIFTNNLFKKIPPFAIGRTFWDKWLIWFAQDNHFPVINATTTIKAIHQAHSYNKGAKNIWEGNEALNNLKIAGGFSHGRTISETQTNLFILLKYKFISLFDKMFFLYPVLLKIRFWSNKFHSNFPKQ